MPRDTSLPGTRPIQVTFRYAAEIYKLARRGLRPALSYALASKTSNGSRDRFLDDVIAILSDVPVIAVTQSVADQSAQKRYPHASSATRKRNFYAPLNAVLGFCERSGLCPAKRLVSPPVPWVARTRCLQPDEVVRMFRAAKPHIVLIFLFMLGTGATNSELFHLDWSDIDLDRREVAYPTRVATLPDELVALLRSILNKEGPVIRRPDGMPYARKVNSGGQYKTTLATLLPDAGITDFCPRDLVTTFAMSHLALHQDYAKLARDSGWPERTIRHYKRVSAVMELPRLRDALFALRPPIIPGGLPKHPNAPWGG